MKQLQAFCLASLLVAGCGGSTGGAPTPPPANHPPSTPTVSITPADFAGDTASLVCTSSASDPDGDAVSIAYVWTRNGGATNFATSNVPGSATAPGETWVCAATASDGNLQSATATASVRIATEVPAGILPAGTTWPASGSPYLLPSTPVQATNLTIEPGVTVIGGFIEMFGTFAAVGTANQRVTLRQVGLVGRPASIDIGYAHVIGGNLLPDEIPQGGLALRDSVVENWRFSSALYNAGGTASFERNVFLKLEVMYIGGYGNLPVVRNNVFYMPSASVETLYGDPMIVELNSFIELTGVVLRVRCNGTTAPDMSVARNYWGGVPDSRVPDFIWDANDDLNCHRYMPFLPTLPAPDPATPDPTPWIK